MSKINLKKLTMSFASAAVAPAPAPTPIPTPTPTQPTINAAALVSQKIAQMKEAQAPGTAQATLPSKATQATLPSKATLAAKPGKATLATLPSKATLAAKPGKATLATKPGKATLALVQVKPEVVKTPVAKKVLATAVKKDRDLNTLLSNNFRTFRVVGTTQFKGSQKIWFANETATKIKNMEKQGHTDSNFIHLPKSMTKEQALAYLAENPTLLPQYLVSEKQERLTAALKPRK